MNKKKIISTILACAMLPFGGLISASAQDTKPTYVQLNPADASPFNNGEFQGWGTAVTIRHIITSTVLTQKYRACTVLTNCQVTAKM